MLLVGDAAPLTALAEAGYDAVRIDAARLEEALSAATWDLVLVGWSQQGVDALRVCRTIRAHPGCLDVPVVVLASVDHGDRPADALEMGADDYVSVPWEPVELQTRVRLALTGRRVSETESRWYAMVANLPGVVYRCELDAEWTMIFISDRAAELTGYPAADFIGNSQRTFADIIHPGDRPGVEVEVAAAVETAQPFNSDYRIVRADGRIRHVVDRGRLVDSERGRRWVDGFIVDVTLQREAEQRLRETLAAQATIDERSRIARDLHDSVSQSLFSMTLHARAAQLALDRRGDPGQGPEHRSISELRGLTRTALAEMRALIFELRPDALADEGLVTALRKHTAAIAAREAMPVALEAPERVDLAADVEEALYRFVQEALHNVVKHASADTVTVRVRSEGDRVVVGVRDDGIGFDSGAPHSGHFGLLTMRERISRVGGTLDISSHPTRGAHLCARVPIRGTGENLDPLH